MAHHVTLPAVDVPVVEEVDVLVCGGGPAGTAAAYAAAKLGARTLVVERYNCLGGLATGGLVLVIPRFRDSGRQVIGGIGIEFRDRLLHEGEAIMRSAEQSSWYFDPEGMKSVSIDLLREAGAKILLHSWCSDVVMQDGKIDAVVAVSKAGKQAFRAKMVVDTTGDLDVGHAAGAEFEKSDFGIGVCFRLGGVDVAKWQQARREDAQRISELHERIRVTGGWEGFMGMSPMASEKTQAGVVWGNNQVVTTGDALDPWELTRVEIKGRDATRTAVKMLREEMPGFENCWLIDIAPQTGVRYSRRLMGSYVITGTDAAQFDFRHPDSVARGNDFRKEGIAFDIPRQSLVSRNVPNLLSAGRSLSCDHEAQEPMREIHVCWTSGQGAGVVAALAAHRNMDPAQVPIEDIRKELISQGAVVGGPEGASPQ